MIPHLFATFSRAQHYLRLSLISTLLLGLSLLASACWFTIAHAAGSISISDCASDAQLQSTINNANNGTGPSDILFSCTGSGPFVIALSSTLMIRGTITLDGNGQQITLDGHFSFSDFHILSTGKLTLTGLTLTGGDPPSSPNIQPWGGGVYNERGTLNITNSVVTNNAAIFGGGLFNDSGVMNIANSTVSNNGVQGGDGAGIFNGGTMSITNSLISGNQGGQGSGINNLGTGNVSITNNTFVSNIAASTGGAIYNLEPKSIGSVSITNNTFVGNSSLYGGGIYNDKGADISLMNNTLANNHGQVVGGGIYNSGASLSSSGNILSNNIGGNCTGGTPTDQGYNLSSDSSCNFTTSTSQQNIDPMLASSLASNGGATQTLALLSGSPAINKIPGSACTISTDQRGVSRPQGPACDIGAFEFRVPTLSMPTSPITVSATSATGAVVTYSVTASEPDDASATPTVSCTPTSGSIFPVGTTTVNCTVSDAVTPPDSTTGSFQVVVTSADPITQLTNLITLVNSDHLKQTIQVSLDTELQVAKVAVQKNNTKVACVSLGLFVTEVKTLTGHGITSSQASQLLMGATTIRTEVGC